MSANERGDPVAGPFGNLSQVWCGGLDQLAKGYEPTLRNMSRINLELMSLMTRRAQAWLEIPARASQCKTPQDLVREQLQFWQTAAHDYTEGARRLSATFSALAGPGFNGAWGGNTVATPRDYITFAEPKVAAADPPKRDRRAA
jgi:Phasin protein